MAGSKQAAITHASHLKEVKSQTGSLVGGWNAATSGDGVVSFAPSPLIRTYTAKNTSNLPGSFLCDQPDPNCGPGDAQAKAAHKYAIGTYNLYATKHGRDSIDNNGAVIVSTVHYCSSNPYFPCPYDNAQWNGYQMVYGGAHGYALADEWSARRNEAM